MHRIAATLIALMAALLLSPAARAEEPCSSASSVTQTVADLTAAADTQGNAEQPYQLPAGELTAEDLEKAFQQLMEGEKGIMGLFGLLADDQERTISGDVVRQMFEKYGVELDFLPLDALKGIVAVDGKVTFQFDFGGAKTRELKLPTTEQKVLDSRYRDDPTLVHRKNRVKTVTNKGKTLRLNQELEFSVNENGLTGLREGDLAVHHWLAGWVNIDLHSERHEGRTATDDKERPVLQTDGEGNPRIENNHYQVQTYDDWVVLEAAGRRIEIGVPALQD